MMYVCVYAICVRGTNHIPSRYNFTTDGRLDVRHQRTRRRKKDIFFEKVRVQWTLEDRHCGILRAALTVLLNKVHLFRSIRHPAVGERTPKRIRLSPSRVVFQRVLSLYGASPFPTWEKITTSSWRSSSDAAGPRAKCDQVIYEAIAKACEIVVLNRCDPTRNNNRTSGASCGRFNLQIPEISSVRKVLSPYKRSLHVPLRLDVYCTHPSQQQQQQQQQQGTNNNNNTNNNHSSNERRELLERWLIEYAPCHSTYFTQECNGADPLIQLRHVCKKLVIWCRTLYCLAKLLPCATSPRIGFSIYVSDKDRYQDIEELTVASGFKLQSHSSCYTPYGRLDMECLYAPKEAIQKLFPKQPTARWVHDTTGIVTQPIPLSRNNNNNNDANRNNHQRKNVAKSAPSHLAIIPDYTSNPSPSNPATRFLRPQLSVHTPTATHHHTASPLRLRSNTTSDKKVPHQSSSARTFFRSNSSDGRHLVVETTPPLNQQQQPQQQPQPPNPAQSKRVLSGLSLAMMNAEGNSEDQEHIAIHSPPSPRSEQRRAALHHQPPRVDSPKLTPQQVGQMRHPGEYSKYGYAYNNQIPWGQMPSNTNTNNNTAITAATHTYTPPLHAVPSPVDGGGIPTLNLSTTPPQPMFATNTPSSLTPIGMHSRLLPPISSTKQQIRSSPDKMTPPFAAMPMTLLDAPKAPTMEWQPPPYLTPEQAHEHEQQAVLPPITSLDLLQSSPFHPIKQQGSQLSSLSGGLYGSSRGDSYMSSRIGLSLQLQQQQQHPMSNAAAWMLQGNGGAAGSSAMMQNNDNDEDGMPFAVDTTTTVVLGATAGEFNGIGGAASSTSIATAMDASTASAAVMAQKCASRTRLKLFDSQMITKEEGSCSNATATEARGTNEDPTINVLADQLAEFRSFGASLQLTRAEASVIGGGSDSSSRLHELRT